MYKRESKKAVRVSKHEPLFYWVINSMGIEALTKNKRNYFNKYALKSSYEVLICVACLVKLNKEANRSGMGTD